MSEVEYGIQNHNLLDHAALEARLAELRGMIDRLCDDYDGLASRLAGHEDAFHPAEPEAEEEPAGEEEPAEEQETPAEAEAEERAEEPADEEPAQPDTMPEADHVFVRRLGRRD